MKWMRENKITGIIDETFSYQYDNFGKITSKEIV